jgi:hypothetical protein
MLKRIQIHLKVSALVVGLAAGLVLQANGQTRALSNPNASPEAKALYCYIQSIYGKKMLAGQMWSGWGFDELAYIQTNTGKQPAIMGLDFIQESVNNTQVTLATNWWKKGGIPTMMWHWGAPSKGEGYPASMLTIDIRNCFISGTPEYTAFWAELTKKADHLQALRDANVPVLWRPYHELNGGWFWWSKGNGASNETNANKAALFKQLWTTMYNYFVNTRQLNNLVWVLCYTGSPDGTWFPGNQYVDIAGGDEYASTNDPQLALFNKVKGSIGGNTMPITLHECGIPPDPSKFLSTGATWSWFMEWHTSYIQNLDKTYLKTVYTHDVVITLDELPNIMAACGGTTNPTPTVTLTSPANNTAVCEGAAITINATATVSSGTISKVDFYDGTTLLGTDNTSPYSYSWKNAAAGEHTIKAIGTSAANVTSTATLFVTVNANPIVTITSPANNAVITSFPSNIIINASVIGTRITNVQFYNGTNLLGQDASSPFSYAWNNLSNGTYTLIAKATNSNNCADTASSKVTVNHVVTDLDETLLENGVAYFPNPFSQSFTIRATSSFHYTMYDLSGNEVEKGVGTTSTSAGQHLSAGIYMVKIESENSTQMVKVKKF